MPFSVRQTFPALLRGAIDLALPPACWVCGQLTMGRDVALCEGCEHALAHDPGPTCSRCGATQAPAAAAANICPTCLKERFAFDGVLRLGEYAGELRDAVLRMKHAAGEPFAETMARVFARHLVPRLPDRKFDAVVPVPLHWLRRLRRGYNQSETLGRSLSRALGVPLESRALRRRRWAPYQSRTKDREERRRHVRGAFEACRPSDVKGRTFLLVDDVLTTGATADEAARVLQKVGARAVTVAVLARASPLRNGGPAPERRTAT